MAQTDIQYTRSDDYTVTETVAGMRRLKAHDGSGDWFLLYECRDALKKPRLRTKGEWRKVKIWHGPRIGTIMYALIRPDAVMDYAREYSSLPAAWWREALHIGGNE